MSNMPGDNELTKVMSPHFKKNKQSSIQLEGFELANIENPTATEDELRQQAREVSGLLHIFSFIGNSIIGNSIFHPSLELLTKFTC